AAGALTETGTLHWATEAVPEASEPAQKAVVTLTERPTGEFTQLWDQTFGASSAGTRRTSEFVDWRYVKHSVFNYRIFEARLDGRVGGLAVHPVEARPH